MIESHNLYRSPGYKWASSCVCQVGIYATPGKEEELAFALDVAVRALQ